MQYPAKIYELAAQELRVRRLSAMNELDRQIERLREHYPDIYELRRQMLILGINLGKASLAYDQNEYGRLLADIKAAYMKLSSALVSAGLPEDYLEAPHTCKLCNDKGIHMGQFCECRKQILNRYAYEMLSDISSIDGCDFNTFDLGYYDEAQRKIMTKLLEACRRYAAEFSHKNPNLLFMGAPGLGKTHLSLAIAREVVGNGKHVIYASAGRLIERLVDSAMGNEREDEYRQLCYNCDLLLLDDLGTEYKTHVTKTEVYNIINARIIEQHPTIISTNLSVKELETTYDQRIFSRLIGNYVTSRFDGKDIRMLKKWRNINGKTEKREAPGSQKLAGG